VPFGKYKNPNICDENNFLLINKLLQKVEIYHGDYSECKKYIGGKTMLYFDPPYRPITQTAAFLGYSQNGFDDTDQKTLAEFVKSINASDTKIMLSNSDPKNTDPNDSFFDDLYRDFDINRIQARRMINCQAEKRGNITEIVVRNYTGEIQK